MTNEAKAMAKNFSCKWNDKTLSKSSIFDLTIAPRKKIFINPFFLCFFPFLPLPVVIKTIVNLIVYGRAKSFNVYEF